MVNPGRKPFSGGMLLLCLIGGMAWAHNPIVINGGPTDATTAHKIDDITVSRVAYHHVLPSQAYLWLTFDGKAGQEVVFQMGLPKLDRYDDRRPVMALVGPNLPEAGVLPFPLPDGMGAVLFTTEGQTPTVFDEKFTGTTDWQFNQEHYTLPQDGTYYFVTYLPSSEEGKVWIAPGTAEKFGLWDLIRMPAIIIKVRLFHEIFLWGGILGWAYLAILLVLLSGITTGITLLVL